MVYAESPRIEPGLRFKTRSGLIVETTGATQHVESRDIYVHEVVVVEGAGQGSRFLHNLDMAEEL